MTTFNCLSLEMKILVFQKLNKSSRLTCKLVCTEWLEILMLGIEFKNDRALKFSKCYYETNRLPVSLFENLSYNTYFCKSMDINYYTYDDIDFDNIPTVFWSSLENDLYYLNLDDTVEQFDGKIIFNLLNKILSKCKLTGLRVSDYHNVKDLYQFVKNKHPLFKYTTIERLSLDLLNSNSTKYLKDQILFLFPNLKTLTFENFNLVSNFDADYKNCIETPFTLNIDTISNSNMFKYLPPHNRIVTHRDFKEYSEITCAKVNDCITFEYSSYSDQNINIQWNPYLKVEHMKIIIKSSFCFFTHEPINAYYLKILNLEFKSALFCNICYTNLLKNIHNIEEITVNCKNTNDLISFDVVVSDIIKYCNKQLKILNYLGLNFTKISFDGFLNIEMLSLNIKYWIYKKELKCLHKKFPKLKTIIVNFDGLNVKPMIVDILCNSNKALEKIEITYENYLMKKTIRTIESIVEISTLLLNYGPKIRVSN